jgi:hypothetical protein
MSVPQNPKIYHIVHMDRLASILADGCLWSDGAMQGRSAGTVIGMGHIKARRLNENVLMSHLGLMVGQCVPFYFCPRSVMLYMMYIRSHELVYKGGQEPIIHLVADLQTSVAWAEANQIRWAFTLSNAGSRYFEDRANLSNLNQIDWSAVQSNQWSASGIKERKQAEFLVEGSFPWHLIEAIGVCSREVGQQIHGVLAGFEHRPPIQIKPDWYY